MTERDEKALRQALEGLGSDEPVDLGRVRRRVAERRRNSRTVAGLAVALVLVGGVIGLPQLLPGGGNGPSSVSAESGGETGGGAAQPEADTSPDAQAEEATLPPGRTVAPSTDPAPDGWRTEYYRDINFQVPASWGYAAPPMSDWCANGRPAEPTEGQRRPYVWLGTRMAVRAIKCPTRPASLLSEHVEALAPGPAVDYVEGAVRQGEWWVVTRFAGSAVLVVTTQDRARAEQILDSARVNPEDAPCAPSSPIAGPLGARPDRATDLSTLGPVDKVVLCQYEPTEDASDAALPRLRAVRQLSDKAAQDLLDDLAAAPVNDSRCNHEPIIRATQLAVVVQIGAPGEVQQVFVNPSGCPDGKPGMVGGIDDGRTVRLLTRPVCSALLSPPVALWSANGDVARNCLG